MKKYYAKEETLEKVRQLQGKKLVNKDGEEGEIELIMKVKPYDIDVRGGDMERIMRTKPYDTGVREGDMVIVGTSKEGNIHTSWYYAGEKGLQILLRDWKEKNES